MKSIKEKAEEYRRVIKVINEHESLVDTQGSEMFIAGANYVLEVVETILEDKDLDVEETYDKIRTTIKQLKK
jgi:hypothetical protein